MFVPKVKVVKSGDSLTILIRQKYNPRGKIKVYAYRWRIAGVFSLTELAMEEMGVTLKEWYPYVDLGDCPRFSTCKNCTKKSCPVVTKAKKRLKRGKQ